jgi:isoleucyl-tRNA synthetase
VEGEIRVPACNFRREKAMIPPRLTRPAVALRLLFHHESLGLDISVSDNAFTPVPQDFNFSEAEMECIRFWKANRIYEKSLDQRKGAPPFVFYEGPPTANGLPHPGHCLTRTIKDIFPRYKTMAGYYCERKAGWDTHGLPVEVEVCKELGIIDGGKAAIEVYGVERFNRACIDSVFRYQREWEQLTDRIGFWVDLEDAYVTYHQSYVESVWWALKQLYDRGLLYQGHKVVWWWAQGGTALSAGEVGEGYRDTDDPAITVRLALTETSADQLGLTSHPASLLIWTTTPWTLSSNCAACVGPELEYAVVKIEADDGPEILILAAPLVNRYFGEEAEVIGTYSGSALIGLTYQPIFHYGDPQRLEGEGPSDRHWVVIGGDFVDLNTGTGIVHLAPAFGEDDYRACKAEGIGFLCFVKPDGTFDDRVTDTDPYDHTPISGRFCKDADKAIIRLLKERGQLLRQDTYRHPYPFCPRAEQDPLIQYARKSWFIRTSDFIPDFLANNREIRWQPEHIRDGRFGNFLENNVDWAISRERYWGTPLPVWVCEKTGHMECVASYTELMAKPGIGGTEVWEKAKAAEPELNDNLKIHKPYIDAVTYQSPKDPSARMRRVTEVIDVWFDAGSMPFAQWGYPHLPGSEEKFEERFPADFISEAIDQTRGWFYALLSISTVVFGKERTPWPHPFRNCICLGHILGEDGLKLSKRLKNYSEPSVLFEKFSADAMRWSFIAKNPPTSSSRLSEKIVEECQRELLIRWYNVYSFFVIYANLDGFSPKQAPDEFLKRFTADASADGVESSDSRMPYRPRAVRSELDRWMLHEFDRTTVEVRRRLDEYDTFAAAKAVAALVDSLSNWYVRRSRERFWASAWTSDKADAYWTLYECLLNLSRLAAPFTPFFSDVTWRNLASALPGAPESVHLTRYPEADATALDTGLLDEMAAVREAVTLGLSARRTANIKVRQPLRRCEIVVAREGLEPGLDKNRDLLMKELNIKEIHFAASPEQYVTYEVKPNFKVLGPRFGKNVQALKKVLSEGDSAEFYRSLQSGELQVQVGGEAVALSAEEVEVRLSPKDGFAAAQGRDMVVVLTTDIDDELRREGWVRDLVRLVQDYRKDLQLAYDARIVLTVATESVAFREAVEVFREFVGGEVLAQDVRLVDAAPEGARDAAIEGHSLRLLVVSADS